MPRLAPRRAPRASLGSGAIIGILLIVVALLAFTGLALFYLLAPRPPLLDAKNLCPVRGPEGVTVVLVDTSDDLPVAARREARTILDDLITGLPPYYMLDIRVLDVAGFRSKSLFARCNPGDGEGLSEWTSNPRIARMKWIASFREPANRAIESSLGDQKSESSPIMAAIQSIAIDRFSGAAVANADKRLVIISDMVEYTHDYSQYPKAGDLSYGRFKRSPAYLKYRTDLHGAKVTIDYVQRLQPKLDNEKHAEFWHAWVVDNDGVWDAAHRLQGAN